MNAIESLSHVGPVLRTCALEKQYGQGAGLFARSTRSISTSPPARRWP